MSARAWTCFAAVSVLWGVPYLFIKLAVDEVDPGFVAWSRVALGALVLAPPRCVRRLRGLRVRWRPILAYAVLEIVIPFPLISFGEQHVSSSLTPSSIRRRPADHRRARAALRSLRARRRQAPRPASSSGWLAGSPSSASTSRAARRP